MRKLTKKALSLVLCVMLVVSAISCAFSVIADTGYTTVNGNKVYDAPVGLELDGDLSTWVNNNIAKSGTPLYVAENGVLRAADGMLEVNAWEEVGPARFKIPNAVAGTVVKISFDYNVNFDNLATDALKAQAKTERLTSYVFRQYDKNGTKITDASNNLWYTNSGNTMSAEFTMADSDEFFRIIIGSCKSCRAAWEISNIKVVVTHPDGTVETYPATEEEEETITTSTTPNKGWVVYSAPYDFDGAEGMSSWLGNTSGLGNKMIVAENGVLKAGAGILDYSGAWQEVGPARFKIPNAVEGTKVKVSFDFAVNREGLSEEVLTKVNNNERLLWPLVKQYDFSTETTLLEKSKDVFPSQDGQTITSEEFTLTASDNFFRLIIRSARSAKDAWRISNITVTATYPDGTVKTFPVTEDEPETPVEPTAPADSEAPYYDVDGKGIKSTVVEYPHQLKPVDQLANLDFENGFRFWAGGKGKGTYASTAFNIVTDGDNSYAKIPSTGYVSNFQTALFKLDGVTTGDEIVVIYDVKGEDGKKIRIKVEQEFVKSIAVYDVTTGLNTTKKADGVNLINCTPGVPTVIVGTGSESTEFAAQLTDGWTTLVTASNSTLVAPSTGSAYTGDPIADAYYIKLLVTCGDAGVVAGDVIDAAIDNIRIAKVVGGVYTDVATGEVIYEDPSYGKVAKVGDGYYATLEEAIAAANGGTVVLLKDVALEAPITIAKDTTVTIDLNGFAITGVDTTEKSYALIYNCGTLTIEDAVGTGKITASATINSGWNRYSSVLSNNPGGKLTVNGGTIEHLGGTDMAYAIDNLTNGKGTYAETIINGGTIKSTYTAIRQFLNGIEAQNILTINGGTIMSDNRAIFFQDPSKNANTGTLTVTANAEIYGDIRLSVTEGSTEWPVEVSIAAGALKGDSQVTNNYLPDGYVIENNNGTFGVAEKDPVAAVNGVNYYDLQEAINAANGGTVVLLADVALEAPVTIAKDTVVTIDLNGFTLSAVDTTEKNYGLIQNNGTLTINDTVGTGKITVSATINSGWNRYSAAISNNPGGTLVVNGGTIEHLGGTDMAYGIDSLTNGNIGDVSVTINGGTVTSTYRAIRQFLNSDSKQNVLIINGGTINGENKSIFFHDPSTKANNGTLTVGAEAEINGDIYLFVTEGSTEWPVEVSIASAAIKSGSVVSKNVPEGLAAKETNGIYGIVELSVIATINGVNYYDLQEAINAANGGTVILATNVVLDAPLTIAKDTVVTIDLNGKKITYTSTTQAEAMISNKGTLTINDTVGGGEIYYDYVGAADPSYGKGNYTIDNAGTLTLNGGKINIATLRQHAKYPINNNSTTGDAIFVMNGGALYNYNTSAIRQFCNSTVYQNSVTINGGLVEGYSAIWVQNPGKNTVNGTLTITGGEIKTTAAAYVNGSATVGEVSSSIYFTIDGEGGAWSETSAVVITGGTFNENVYLVEEAPANLTVDETAPTYNGRVELPVPPVVEEYDLETELYWVKGFKPAGSEDTRYGFLMTIGIDSLDYKKDGCGFYLTVGDTTKKFVIVNGTVWESLSVDLPEGTEYLAPVDFGEGNNYIMHYTVYFTEAELAALGSMEVSVKGFVTTFEGEELVTRTFNCGTLA